MVISTTDLLFANFSTATHSKNSRSHSFVLARLYSCSSRDTYLSPPPPSSPILC